VAGDYRIHKSGDNQFTAYKLNPFKRFMATNNKNLPCLFPTLDDAMKACEEDSETNQQI